VTRGIVAEAVGTALLLVAVVGSGIMAERLAGGNLAIALLANAVATGGALVALILTFGPISRAHFNPVVTLAFTAQRTFPPAKAAAYVLVQCVGAVCGVWLAHLMFGLPILEASKHARGTFGELVGEFVSTFGLLGLILSCDRHSPSTIPYGVAAYITGAYWFTSSTSFANPAVTIARSLTSTFAGIAPAHVPGFILAELLGGAAAFALFGWLLSQSPVNKSANRHWNLIRARAVMLFHGATRA
jgi:glycerol uptake facilitator-like aquaporin